MPRDVPRQSAPKEPAHPFDTPAAIMQSIHNEVTELRRTVTEARERHDRELAELRQEVQLLKSALAREEALRAKSDDAQIADFKAEVARRNSEFEAFRANVKAEFQKRTPVKDFEALHANFVKLDSSLGSEKVSRRSAQDELERRIEANTVDDSAFAQSVMVQLKDHKKAIDDNNAKDEEFASNILPRVQLAGKMLLAAGDMKSRHVQEVSESLVRKATEVFPKSIPEASELARERRTSSRWAASR
mmetsp:Transcript_41602/g.114678  ORF Transcript_41602/g.114678 Transcript_41602/m.114678 type:complete len:246 (+) Transcript_41602:115-852(+)|eukprot:CAMPEP_0117559206 /NCGR_PEP_ID=MMETSP0784-20121206/53238_1 /TAXON_ID=39447 /ORGANISM="" /LENGTH=245 /DNA_ID=CAMNT_0005356571 /DNA_START=99 /DNA_END=836 /DNA_ORIENTATION=+